MKLVNIFFYLLIPVLGLGQENEMSVYLSSDEILLGNTITVRYEINSTSANFNAPIFEKMLVIAGPKVSSSFSIVNGLASQSLSYEYIVEPSQVGQNFIPSASFNIEEQVFENTPIEINVLDNFDGTIQNRGTLKKRYSSIDTIQLTPDEQKYKAAKEKLKKYRKKY